MNNHYLFIFIILFSCCSLKGQVVTLGFGPTYIFDKERVSMHPEAKGNGVGGNDDWLWQVNYEHFLSKNWIVFGRYSKYPIATLFHFYKENEGGSTGWNGTNVHRFDFGIGYNIFSQGNFIVQPNLGLGLQRSIPDGSEIIGNEIPQGIKPDNFELLNTIKSQAFSNTQLVPIVGVKFGFAFWGRLELFMEVQQVFGHKTIQELRMSYSYKGIVQPEAISYSDGTGRFLSLGLGYRFIKQKSR